MPGSAASATSSSASGGPSISTMSGRCPARAARTDRADPGPWCRIPKTVVLAVLAIRAGDIAAGAVEVAPVVAVPDHRLQVLLPHRAVRDRILHDGAGDAASYVGRPQHPVAEV